MAKAKSNKKNQNKNALENCNNGNDKKSKVSSASPASIVEKWDIVRKVDPGEEVACRMEGCERAAVECWSSNFEPDDEWNLCHACVDVEFGPEIPPPMHDDDTPQDDVAEHLSSSSNKPIIIAAAATTTPTEEANTTGSNEPDAAKHVSDNSSDEDNGDDEKQSSNTNQDGSNHKTSIETSAFETPAAAVKTPAIETPATAVETPSVESPAAAVETPLFETPVASYGAPGTEKWDVVRKIDDSSNEGTVCRMDGCERSATECWASNLELCDVWEMCSECVELEFGPEESTDQDSKPDAEVTSSSSDSDKVSSKDDAAALAMTPTDEANVTTRPTETQDALFIAVVPCAIEKPSSDKAGTSDENLEDEAWDVKKVMSHTDLSKDGTIKCGTESCILAAATVYMSTLTNEKWYTCLDCQVIDYCGWPEKLHEIPIKSMTHEHKQIMAQKCSRLSSPVFPNFEESPTKASRSANTLTPPPRGAKQVTPTPGKKSQPSAQAMAIHRKWQAAAESMGGQKARIVVDKKAAKQLIVDLLYDAFRPMNITQIHAALKAIVPSPVLKQCLDDMALDKDNDENMFAESDDDEAKAKNKKKPTVNSNDEFAGALAFKAGRNSNTSLYFLDHTKQKNNGNGLEVDVRNQLHTDKALSEQERAKLKRDLSQMEADTKRLLGEPTNEVANTDLEIAEAAMTDLRGIVEDARKLKVNEKHKKETKRRIEGMTVQWRKRRRLCMDFLISMEENTDGTISMKKCLSGDGQIDVESDDKAIKDSKTYAENKRARKRFKPVSKKSSIGTKTQDFSSQIAADENFIGVELNTQGLIGRVFLDNTDDE